MIDPDVLATTRGSLHAVGEHVLGAALYQGRRRIGLRQVTGGFATQNYLHLRDGAAVERRAMVVGTEIIVRDDDLAGGTIEDRAPITTLAAAGALVDVVPGMPADMYTPAPMPAVDEELGVDAEAVAFLAELTAIGYAALVILCAHFVRRRAGRDPALAGALRPGHLVRRGQLRALVRATPTIPGRTSTSAPGHHRRRAASGTNRSEPASRSRRSPPSTRCSPSSAPAEDRCNASPGRQTAPS